MLRTKEQNIEEGLRITNFVPKAIDEKTQKL